MTDAQRQQLRELQRLEAQERKAQRERERRAAMAWVGKRYGIRSVSELDDVIAAGRAAAADG